MGNTLNIHNVVGDALTVVNAWRTMIFTKQKVEWVINAREPQITEESIELKGKIQPASNQDIEQLGLNSNTYQYFKIYLTGTPTQLDRVRQLGCDTFVCNGLKYRLTGKTPWDDAGWRRGFCYLDKVVEEEPISPNNGD